MRLRSFRLYEWAVSIKRKEITMGVKKLAKFVSNGWVIEQTASNSSIWRLSCTEDQNEPILIDKRDIDSLLELCQAVFAVGNGKTEG